MQGIRCITCKKILSVVIFLTCLLGMASVYAAESSAIPPEIFIGDTPNAIKIQQGMPVKMPICFVGGTLANKEVELYVFRVQDGEYFCLGSNGWNSDYARALEDFKPLCTVPSLPKYINLNWQAFDNTQSLSNFDLWVCVDDNIDKLPTENSIYCGHQLVVIGDNDTGARDVSDTGMAHQPPPLSRFWHPGGDNSGSTNLQAPSFPGFNLFTQQGGATQSSATQSSATQQNAGGDTSPENGTTLTFDHYYYPDIGPGKDHIYYFKFETDASGLPIYINNTPESPYSVHALVKEGSKPTIDDFNYTWGLPYSQSGTGGLYWYYNTGSPTERVKIGNPTKQTMYYIMLYNTGSQTIQTRVTVTH